MKNNQDKNFTTSYHEMDSFDALWKYLPRDWASEVANKVGLSSQSVRNIKLRYKNPKVLDDSLSVKTRKTLKEMINLAIENKNQVDEMKNELKNHGE